MIFFWLVLECQVCIEGSVEKVIFEEFDVYYQVCLLGSCLGVWVLLQSWVIVDCVELEWLFVDIEWCFVDQLLSCFEYWGGYCFLLQCIEFWQGWLSCLYDCFDY